MLDAARRYRHWRTDLSVGTAFLLSLIFIWWVAKPDFFPERQAIHAGHLGLLFAHIFGGTAMLVFGAIALRIGLTREWFRWHKVAGYSYIIGGSVGAIVALIRSFDTKHTPGLATGALAVVWLLFTGMAYRAILNRRIDQHRAWMIRSYVAALTFTFCRFWTRVMPSALQGGETDMIWLTWTMPLFFAEAWLQWKAGARLNRAG